MLHCHQVSISSRLRDTGPWSRDLDLSWSRDVIGHVTIGLGMGHFLLVVLWTQVSISNGFRDIPPQMFGQGHAIRYIRHVLTTELALTPARSLILSRLDY